MTQNTLLPHYAQNLENDHPVRMYCEENIFFKKILEEFAEVNPATDPIASYNLVNQIERINIRYTRKENQLFPYLEKRGWNGPSQGMWRFQDDNRALIKKIRLLLEKKELSNVTIVHYEVVKELFRMTQVEEMRLFPIALDILQPQDWQEMKKGESEIGWMHIDEESRKKIENANNPKQPTATTDISDLFIKLNEGQLLREQIDLILQVMPFDITFVDENDKVAYYNRGDERVFPRSAGVIGREVRFCHPPKSVHMVLEIVEEFKSGRKNVAEFWINFKGRNIHIRYFAVRDKNKTYKGVLEVSQDITDIKKIDGERRLLQWEK